MINKMNLILLLVFLTCRAQSQDNDQKIQIGSKIPEFSLPDQNGKEFDSKDVVGKDKLVIYFYPKDETPGCTKEACSFRDNYEVFKNAGARVIGISGQSVESHKKFAENHKLPFTLLSDEDNKVRKQFGVKAGPIPGRVTFVVDMSGTVVYTFDSQAQATRHVEEAMRVIKEMN